MRPHTSLSSVIVEVVSEEQADERGPVEIYPLLRWTIPLHALLPLLIGVVGDLSDGAAEQAMVWIWAILHFAFPVFLVVSYPWWKGRGEEVLAVLVINHVVTLGVAMLLFAWWPQ